METKEGLRGKKKVIRVNKDRVRGSEREREGVFEGAGGIRKKLKCNE